MFTANNNKLVNMDFLVLAVCCFFAVLSTPTWAQTGGIRVCLAPFGDFPNMFSETCQTFFRCTNNVPQLMRCPRGYRYDFNTRTCRRGHLINCKDQISLFSARYLLHSLYNNNNNNYFGGAGAGLLGNAGAVFPLGGTSTAAGRLLRLGTTQNNLLRGNVGIRHAHVVPGIGVINHKHPIAQTKVAVVNGQLVTKVVPHTHPFVTGANGQNPTFITGRQNKTTQEPVTARTQIPVPAVTTEPAVKATTSTTPLGTTAATPTVAGVKKTGDGGRQNLVAITKHDVIPYIMT